MCANSESSGKSAGMRRLTWAFAGHLCDKYHNLMSWLINTSSDFHNQPSSTQTKITRSHIAPDKDFDTLGIYHYIFAELGVPIIIWIKQKLTIIFYFVFLICWLGTKSWI